MLHASHQLSDCLARHPIESPSLCLWKRLNSFSVLALVLWYNTDRNLRWLAAPARRVCTSFVRCSYPFQISHARRAGEPSVLNNWAMWSVNMIGD
jgi:hypothetical protein